VKDLNTNTNYKRELKKISLENCVGKKLSKGKIIFKGKNLYNFSSNDYMGLSNDKDLIASSNLWTRRFGTSLSSSRLISGNLDKISNIEKKIAKFKNKDEAIILGSGFQCNLTAIPAFIGNSMGKRNKAIIFSDKLNHSSINHGCVLTKQKIFRYNHLDYNHLEYLLKKTKKNELKLIISETVFSMDGDIVDVSKIRFLALKYNCLIYFDEAHATGIFGSNGFGITSNLKKNDRIDNEIAVGTFSKSFGSYGSYIACSKEVKNRIVNLCAGLIYSTVLPPSVLGAIDCAVNKIPKMKEKRLKLIENSNYLKSKLEENKFLSTGSNSQIIPILFKDEKHCILLSKIIIEKGFFVLPIIPPTVPDGKSRLRISLTTLISKETINKFIKTLLSVKKID